MTAGHQGAPVKRNLQIAENTPIAYELGDLILAELVRALHQRYAAESGLSSDV